MKFFLKKLFRGEILSRVEACDAMTLIMKGGANPEEIAGFLGAIAARGETSAELVGCVEAMRAQAVPFPVKRRDLIDVCGTGGDGANTFNVSTTNALLLAAAGLGVVKHGNRAVSSQSGSADLLEILNIAIDGSPDHLAEQVDALGFAFLFAPLFHPAMSNVSGVRKALGVRTLFNLLGPLANPAPVTKQIIGVYEKRLVVLVAEALRDLGTARGLVVCGEDGLDEFSLSGSSFVADLDKGRITTYTVTPEDFGLTRAPVSAIQGGSSQENADITQAILSGKKGPSRDIVVMNAAAALVVSGHAKSWLEGTRIAGEVIDLGHASAKLKALQRKV
ncbi:MAG: anthranilate phosphoribosyltransferase [Chitinophagaceae bacterium]|nr:anthranilate phosphoribosyltransferase [Oligoflexus sp.]